MESELAHIVPTLSRSFLPISVFVRFFRLNLNRGLSDGDLMKLGIVDTPLANQRQRGGKGAGNEGIFQSETLRAFLMGLVCTADPVQPPSEADRELFERFDFIEGHPHVC